MKRRKTEEFKKRKQKNEEEKEGRRQEDKNRKEGEEEKEDESKKSRRGRITIKRIERTNKRDREKIREWREKGRRLVKIRKALLR